MDQPATMNQYVGLTGVVAVLQINRHYHAVKSGAYTREHIDQGVTFLIQLIKTMRRTKQDWSKEWQLKGTLCSHHFLSHDAADGRPQWK